MKFENTFFTITTKTKGSQTIPYDKRNEFLKGAGPIYEVDNIEIAFKSIAGIPNGVKEIIDELYSVKTIVATGNGAIENLEWNNSVLEAIRKLVIAEDFTGSSFQKGLPKNLAGVERLNGLSLLAGVEYFNEDAIRELMSKYVSNCVLTTITSIKILKMAIRAIIRPETNWQKEAGFDYNGNIMYLNPSSGHLHVEILCENQLTAECFDDIKNLKSIKIESMLGVIDGFEIFIKLLENSSSTLEHLIMLNIKSTKYSDTLCTIAAMISPVGAGDVGMSFNNLKTFSVSTALITDSGMNGLVQPVQALLNKQFPKIIASFIPHETPTKKMIIPDGLCNLGDWKAFTSRTIVGFVKSRISRRAKDELLKGNPPEWVLDAIIGLRI